MLTEKVVEQGVQSDEQIVKELDGLSVDQIQARLKILEKNLSAMNVEQRSLNNKIQEQQRKTDGNKKRVGYLVTLPYLVSNVVEILDIEPEEQDLQDLGTTDLNATLTGKGVVIKTTTRQTVFLPVPGLLDAKSLKPGELIGVNKDGYMLYERLPAEYDARVKTMEVDERPSEDYSDIGGLEKQIEELREAIVLPITHKDKFDSIGIRYSFSYDVKQTS